MQKTKKHYLQVQVQTANIVATYVDTLQKSYGQRCPHCGTVASIYTATDVTFDATSYRQYVAAKSVIFKYQHKYQTFIRVEGKPQGEKPNSLYTLSEV